MRAQQEEGEWRREWRRSGREQEGGRGRKEEKAQKMENSNAYFVCDFSNRQNSWEREGVWKGQERGRGMSVYFTHSCGDQDGCPSSSEAVQGSLTITL